LRLIAGVHEEAAAEPAPILADIGVNLLLILVWIALSHVSWRWWGYYQHR
jgi:hypothetical protein